MIKTLKDLRMEALKNPRKYGRGRFFDKDKNPVCPIAVEIIPEYYKDPEGAGKLDLVEYAAKKIGCTRNDIWVFTNWWDTIHFNCQFVGEEKKS